MKTSPLHARAPARRCGTAAMFAMLVAMAGGCADPRQPVGLSVTGGDYGLSLTQRAWLRAYEVYSDGSSTDVTAATDWVSSDSTVATVTSRVYDAEVTGLKPGAVTVTATHRELSASVRFTVPPP